MCRYVTDEREIDRLSHRRNRYCQPQNKRTRTYRDMEVLQLLYYTQDTGSTQNSLARRISIRSDDVPWYKNSIEVTDSINPYTL